MFQQQTVLLRRSGGEEKSLGKMKIAHVLLMTPLDAKSSRKYIFETARKNKHAFNRLAWPAMKNANLGMGRAYLGVGGRKESRFCKEPDESYLHQEYSFALPCSPK